MNLKLTPEKKLAFLTALTATCSVTRACQAIDISRTAAYEWRDEDPEFAAAWEVAKRRGAEALEDEAIRRGHEGFKEPVFYQGVATDTIRKYSDTLLIFTLKGAMPEKYAERAKTEITNPDGSLSNQNETQIAAKLAAIQQAITARIQSQEETQTDDGSDLV